MNIFVLDKDPLKSASMYCDIHVIKMIVEVAQILSTVHHANNSGFVNDVYKKTHWNHPCVKWARETHDNYEWLFEHWKELLYQYSKRYKKTHASSNLFDYLRNNPIEPDGKGMTPFTQAMPDKYKNEDVVKAYRDYYNGEKLIFAKWKLGNKPDWVKEK